MGGLEYVHVPGYAAIIFRKTYEDLAKPGALIPRSKDWLMSTDARWNEQRHQWTFPSGATLNFGYLQNDDDMYHYQSSEFQYIGWDELTQFNITPYRYLFSRCRRPSGLAANDPLTRVPLRVRSATNPGGKGHEWVKERFAIEGGVGHNPERPFIPSRLEDNPYLDIEAYEKSLNELDYVTRQQLRNGDWDIGAAGNVFDRMWWQYYDEFPQGRYPQGGIFCDTAGWKEEMDGDYVAIAVVQRVAKDLYWREVVRGHWTFPEVVARLENLHDAYDLPVIIEEVAWALPLLQTLKRKIPGVIGYKPGGHSKEDRAKAASPYAQAGNLYLPRGAAWLPDFIEEHGAFPLGPHDDQVDTTSMAVLRLLVGNAGSGVKTGSYG